MCNRHKTNSCSMLHFSNLVLIFCSCLGFALALDTLRVNQSIHDSEYLFSNNRNFKLGFFTPVNTSYRYVGVMYNIPVLTVVWVANRDNPLNDSNGTIEIYGKNGNLAVLDGQRRIVWSTDHLSDQKSNPSTVARLLNTGNLILQDNPSPTILWESFRHASNAYMPKMRLTNEPKNMLASWKSPNNPSVGGFTASIETLNLPEIVIRNGNDSYWHSGPWNGQVFIGISDMESYVYQNGFQVGNDNPKTVYLAFSYFNTSVLAYLLLNVAGNLQQRVWSEGKMDWEVAWSSVESECDVYNKCGPFGICDRRVEPICACLQGYEPKSVDEWNVGNWTSGCVRKTLLGCEMGKRDGFFRVKTVKLPDRVEWFPSFEGSCGSECLSNCSCIAYAYYAGIGCMFWKGSLVDVQKFSGGGGDLYVRLARTELDSIRDRKTIFIATTLVLGFIAIAVCAYFLLRRYYRGSKRKSRLLTEFSEESVLMDSVNGVKFDELPLFKFETLSNATQNFDSLFKLGEGGFGPVYKGKLKNGQEIAVKRLSRLSNQGLEEFKNEVEVISKLQHRNLVRLLGCCVEREEKMLVYEYMSNGSLDTYLFDSGKQEFLLGWKKRMSVIEGICRGLLYLHRDSRLRIIHRDLKASNILLDEEINPKISDFGTARIFGVKEDQANTTRVVGTFGYMAPEYALQGRFSEKSDVYSFGVVLLEIVSGRRNTSFNNDEHARSLVAYAWNLWNEKAIINLVEPLIYDPRMKTEITRYAHVGLLCVQDIAEDRPNISTVLSMLSSEIVSLPIPKQPAFIAHQRSSETEHLKKSRSKFSANDVTLTIVEGR